MPSACKSRTFCRSAGAFCSKPLQSSSNPSWDYNKFGGDSLEDGLLIAKLEKNWGNNFVSRNTDLKHVVQMFPGKDLNAFSNPQSHSWGRSDAHYPFIESYGNSMVKKMAQHAGLSENGVCLKPPNFHKSSYIW